MSGARSSGVVVVGSGLAGLVCAERVARRGHPVTVISPGLPGRDGATHRVCGHAPWILLTAPDSEADQELFLAELIHRGARAELARILSSHSRSAVRELSTVLRLEPLDPGPVPLHGEQVSRGFRFRRRRQGGLLAPLVERCREAGVRFRSQRLVVGLTRTGDRIDGALSVASSGGPPEIEPARALVLACGGTGGIFPISTQPRWCSGSALALSELAGATVLRPHLCQPLPVWLRPLFFPSSRSLLEGELEVAGRRLETADNLAELTRLVAERLRRGETVHHRVKTEGTAVRRRQLTVAAHHGIGGVLIDRWGRTDVTGLYACGEAAGGVQGDQRLMGTGLLEAWIFGQRAAVAVSGDLAESFETEAAQRSTVPGPLPLRARELLDRTLAPLVALRPPSEVAQTLLRLGQTPTVSEPGEGSWIDALRWSAARILLRHQLEERLPPTKEGPAIRTPA